MTVTLDVLSRVTKPRKPPMSNAHTCPDCGRETTNPTPRCSYCDQGITQMAKVFRSE